MELTKDKYINFIDSIKDKNTKSVFYYYVKTIDKQNINLDEIVNQASLDKILPLLRINSMSSLLSFRATVIAYARFSNNIELFKMIDQINLKETWERIKSNAKPSIISFEDIEMICKKTEIEALDRVNGVYVSSLLMAIYEGIWEENFDVIANLRGSDIHGNSVTLNYSNGTVCNFEITQQLADNMLELSKISVLYRNNKNASFPVDISGRYFDSVFKMEHRNGNDLINAYNFVYRRKVKNAIKKYANQTVSPKNIYMSGIIYRVSKLLQEINMDLQSVLQDNDSIGVEIIKNELIRCNYNGKYSHFKIYVFGHVYL